MFARLFRRNPLASVMPTLYGAIVAQARLPVFYSRLGAADTPDGRFEMIVLHVFILLHRAKSEGEAGKAFAQALFDHFISDMDGSLREMGVGDLTVPKKIKSMGEAFYGRMAAYGSAVTSGSQSELSTVLARNILGNEEASAAALADYVLDAIAALSQRSFATLEQGEVVFPVPLNQTTTGHTA